MNPSGTQPLTFMREREMWERLLTTVYNSPYRATQIQHLKFAFVKSRCGSKKKVIEKISTVWMEYSVNPPEGHSGHFAFTFVICTLSIAATWFSTSRDPVNLAVYICGLASVEAKHKLHVQLNKFIQILLYMYYCFKEYPVYLFISYSDKVKNCDQFLYVDVFIWQNLRFFLLLMFAHLARFTFALHIVIFLCAKC